MLILACDTSGPALSAAIWRNGHLAGEIMIRSGKPHSATLMPVITGLLDQCGLRPSDLDAYACAIGPGSYTGIRIGVSSIKAMAYAAGRPAVGVSSLEAMAWPYWSSPDDVICPMIDARNQRVFCGAWLGGRSVLAEANRQSAEFIRELAGLPGRSGNILLLGHVPPEFYLPDGRPVISGTFMAPGAAALPRASAVAEIAALRLAAGRGASPQLLLPQYLSPSQAERRLAADRA